MSDGFVTYYAIRLPSGALWEYRPDNTQAKKQAQNYWGMPSYLRDMMGVTEPEVPTSTAIPGVFLDRAAAQNVCDQLRARALEVGVDNWGGRVVTAMRTPFTAGDPAVEFAEQIVAWVIENKGGEQ